MNQDTQIFWTKTRLIENGCVSRNRALNKSITRLGSIINKLNSEWNLLKEAKYKLKGHYTEGKEDYLYQIIEDK